MINYLDAILREPGRIHVIRTFPSRPLEVYAHGGWDDVVAGVPDEHRVVHHVAVHGQRPVGADILLHTDLVKADRTPVDVRVCLSPHAVPRGLNPDNYVRPTSQGCPGNLPAGHLAFRKRTEGLSVEKVALGQRHGEHRLGWPRWVVPGEPVRPTPLGLRKGIFKTGLRYTASTPIWEVRARFQLGALFGRREAQLAHIFDLSYDLSDFIFREITGHHDWPCADDCDYGLWGNCLQRANTTMVELNSMMPPSKLLLEDRSILL